LSLSGRQWSLYCDEPPYNTVIVIFYLGIFIFGGFRLLGLLLLLHFGAATVSFSRSSGISLDVGVPQSVVTFISLLYLQLHDLLG